MEHSVAVRPDDLDELDELAALDAPPAAAIVVPPADAVVRRLLRVSVGSPRSSLSSARNAFSASLAVSTVRCLLTYVLLPIAGPVLGLTGSVGPLLGIAVGLVSTVAIVVSMRRFWAADHRMRWGYTAVGGGILVLLAVQAVGDLRTLFG